LDPQCMTIQKEGRAGRSVECQRDKVLWSRTEAQPLRASNYKGLKTDPNPSSICEDS
jgi:hypothetical protein